jgi:hypothetical protein
VLSPADTVLGASKIASHSHNIRKNREVAVKVFSYGSLLIFLVFYDAIRFVVVSPVDLDTCSDHRFKVSGLTGLAIGSKNTGTGRSASSL